MSSKRKINICKNHLPVFFEALKNEDLARIRKIEHVLTSEEECVACSYLFKTKGETRQVLEDFLNKEGFEVSKALPQTGRSVLNFWVTRIFILIVILAIVYFLEYFFKKLLIGNASLSIFSLNLIEYIIISLIAIGVFLYIDDIFLD